MNDLADHEVDFFVSYHHNDAHWGDWIGAELENAGYSVLIEARDIRPGDNRLVRIDEALRVSRSVLGLLSASYLEGLSKGQWTAAYFQTLQGKARAFIPIRVSDCDAGPVLGPVFAIDLVGVTEEAEARRRLIEGVAREAPRPAQGFPGGHQPTPRARFPGVLPEVWELRGNQRARAFVGREDLLVALRARLQQGTPTALAQSIEGLGGVGKTTIAVEYCHRYAGAYDIIWWVRAEQSATLIGDYLELAAFLGLPAIDDPDRAKTALRRELRRRSRWLVVFDNAENPLDLDELLPDGHRGHVIVTTRRPDWPGTEPLRVEVLAPEDAIDYLQRLAAVVDPEVGRLLALALGFLPLALSQAASVIAHGMSPTEYLEVLEGRPHDLLTMGRRPSEATVASTWQIAIHRLSDVNEALALLRFCAFLAAENIPLPLFARNHNLPSSLATVLTDPIERLKVTEALAAYSLASVAGGMVSVHRLVQLVVRSELGLDELFWAEVALRAVLEALPAGTVQPRDWLSTEALLPHSLSAVSHARRLGFGAEDASATLERIATYLLARGRLADALAAAEEGVFTSVALGEDHPVAMASQHVLAQVLHALGELPAARNLFDRVYELRREVLGSEHRDTLSTVRDLTWVRFDEGDRSQILAPMSDLFEISRRVLGPDDPDTLMAMGNLASTLNAQGDHAAARQLAEQVVDGMRRVLGDDHPDTFRAMNNLASTLLGCGDIGEARSLLIAAVKHSRTAIGAHHTITTECAWHLADIHLRSGNAMAFRAVMTRDLAWLDKAQGSSLSLKQQQIRDAMRRAGSSRRR